MEESNPSPSLEMCTNPACGELFEVHPGANEQVVCPACGTPIGETTTPTTGGEPRTPAPSDDRATAVKQDTDQAKPAQPAPPPPAERPSSPEAPGHDDGQEDDEPIGLADDDGPDPAAARRVPPAQPARPRPEPPPAESSSRTRPRQPSPPAKATRRAEPPQHRAKPPDRSGEDAPSGDTGGLFEDLGETLGLDEPADGGGLGETAELGAPPTRPAEAAGDRVLQSQLATGAVLCSGVLGLLGGAWIGVVSMPSAMILGAYLGAAGGWLAGFLMGFLMTLAIDRGEGDEIHCPLCQTSCPPGAETCRWCGASLGQHLLGPVAAECLASPSYAVSNVPVLLWLGMLMLLGGLAVGGASEAARLEQVSGAWGPLLWAVSALVGAWIVSYVFEYVLDAISSVVSGARKAPDAPSPASLRQPAAGAYLVGLAVVYVLPVVTLPLLPIALARLGMPGRQGVFRVRSLARAAWREVRDFEILWLFLLMWALAGALTALVVIQGLTLLARAIPVESQTTRVAVRALWIGLAAGIGGLAGGVWVLSMACCTGAFGRWRRGSISPNPVDRARASGPGDGGQGR